MAFTVWVGFLVAAILIAVSPGPGAAASMSAGLRYGYGSALRVIGGLQSALVIQVGIVAVGLGALLTTSALAFEDSTPKTPTLQVADRFHIRTSPADRSDFALPPYWIKTKDPIEDDPLTRACTLTFMSDLGPVPVARPPGTELKLGVGFSASLDHAIWFHRPFWPTEWHRYEVRSLTNSDSRGLVAGALYDAAGALVASTSQEALWRV